MQFQRERMFLLGVEEVLALSATLAGQIKREPFWNTGPSRGKWQSKSAHPGRVLVWRIAADLLPPRFEGHRDDLDYAKNAPFCSRPSTEIRFRPGSGISDSNWKPGCSADHLIVAPVLRNEPLKLCAVL